jgi:hypothetical protein
MQLVFIILATVCIMLAVIIGSDMLRFRKRTKAAENPNALGTPAGGTLFLKAGKTYYQMPKGPIRKIADFPMDLRPGSLDMARFTKILQQASDEHAQEVAETKIKADEAMHAVAKEEAGE